MEKKYDVLTVLDTCADLIVELGDVVPEFNQKEKLIRDFGLYMGGSACIFAAQCAKLKLSTIGVGVVGADSFGGLVRGTLESCGVDTEYLRTDPAIKTSLGISLNKGPDRSILTFDESILAVTADRVTDELLAKAKHLHIASYYLLGNLAVLQIASRAKSLGLTVSLDTNWDPAERWELPEELLRLVDVFLPNMQELHCISGRRDFNEAIDYFLQFVPILAVKMGEQGAVAVTRRERVELAAPTVKIADTVGAGDSFDGGFVYGFLKGCSLKDSLRIGILCGSANVSRFGGCEGQMALSQLEEKIHKTKDRTVKKGELL